MEHIYAFIKDNLKSLFKAILLFGDNLMANKLYLLFYTPVFLGASFLFVAWDILPNFKFNPSLAFQPIKPGLFEQHST